MMNEFYLSSYDLDWFCYDDNGHIAVLFSNGTTAVLPKSLTNYDVLYSYFYLEFDISTSKTWMDEALKFFACKGVIAYDADSVNFGQYDQCNSPEFLCNISQIPKNIVEKMAKFNGIFLWNISIPLLPDSINLAKLSENL